MKRLVSVEGLSGSGKSTLSKMIADALSYEYVDLDILAKTCYLENEVVEKLKGVFPIKIFDENNEVDFKKLSEIVFKDGIKMNILEEILYPVLESKVDIIIENSKYGCVLDGVKIHKTKFFNKSDLKIFVQRDYNTRVEGLKNRDKIQSIEVKNRDNLVDYEEYTYDLIIENNGDINKLKNNLPFIIKDIVEGDKCLYPGSFDPFTYGHLELIKQASRDYDYVFVGIGNNPDKTRVYDKIDMMNIVNEVLKKEGISNALCFCYNGYTGDIAKRLDVKYIVRGIRDSRDIKSEKTLESYNKENFNLSTKYYHLKEVRYISSSMVKDVFKQGKSISDLVPELIEEYMSKNIK